MEAVVGIVVLLLILSRAPGAIRQGRTIPPSELGPARGRLPNAASPQTAQDWIAQARGYLAQARGLASAFGLSMPQPAIAADGLALSDGFDANAIADSASALDATGAGGAVTGADVGADVGQAPLADLGGGGDAILAADAAYLALGFTAYEFGTAIAATAADYPFGGRPNPCPPGYTPSRRPGDGAIPTGPCVPYVSPPDLAGGTREGQGAVLPQTAPVKALPGPLGGGTR